MGPRQARLPTYTSTQLLLVPVSRRPSSQAPQTVESAKPLLGLCCLENTINRKTAQLTEELYHEITEVRRVTCASLGRADLSLAAAFC